MPTEMGQPYSTLWRGKYPHMLPEDYRVWERYIDQRAGDFMMLYYDVRVGGPTEFPEGTTASMKKMWFDLNAKRIDVLAERQDEVWIIEVTTRPGLRAVGQLATYMALWFDDPKIMKPVKSILIAESIERDLIRAMEVYGMIGIPVG
jgi:hypothetical protein